MLMTEGIPPHLHAAGYRKLGAWRKYEDGEYEKCPCVIELRSGAIVGPCWPNAGKFTSLEGDQQQWGEHHVLRVAYYEM